MPVVTPHLRTAIALAAGLTALSGAAPASARSVNAPDQFPLGQSAQSGAVCQAVRDDDDPASETRGAIAWDVRCRGWDTSLGRLYVYSYKGARQVADGGLWPTALAKRATCDPFTAVTVAGLASVKRAECKGFNAKIPYTAYSAAGRSGRAVAAEGFVQIADVLETGMKVVGRVMDAPKATQTLPAASAAGGGGGGAMGLAQAAEAAASAPANLRERGFNRNVSWRFADAETDFRALALDPNAPAGTRAEAYLNWALNTSNTGRFAQADALFAQAAKYAGASPALRGLALSYQALHLRNQRKFKDAITTARQAQTILSSLQPIAGSTGGPGIIAQPDGSLVIGPELASALKPSTGFSTSVIDPAARIEVQIAQTEITQATCYQALGEQDLAREQLESARAILSAPHLTRVATFLRVQDDAELARQYQVQGRYNDARQLLAEALTSFRKQQPGSPAEAYLTMELARAESLSGDTPQAMQDFKAAIALFRETRGSLGASADSVSLYLDLLMQRAKADPSHASEDAEAFLTAIESVGNQATADTVARLTARLNEKDSASAGLIRALEDTRRQVRAKESAIALLQSENEYTPAIKANSEAELNSLNAQAATLEQQVAAVDPRYGQLVASDVTVKDLQAALKSGELYVKVVLLGTGGYGLAVTHDAVTPYRIPLSEAQGAAAAAQLRRPFEAQSYLPAYDVAGSYALYKALFGPIEDEVRTATHIIYEPDDAILSLPIAALATDQASVDLVLGRRKAIRAKGEGVLSYAGVNWLGRKAQTSLVVSAAAFVQARAAPSSPASKAFIGFGDSVQASASDPKAFSAVVNYAGTGDADVDLCRATRTALLSLKPLREATHELQTVGSAVGADVTLVTGSAFSDSAIAQRNDLDQYRVVYFATHGLLPEPGGCLPEPALLTSVGDGDSDGLLDVSKIIGLKLDADLVVLSACDTGGGGVGGDNDTTGLGGGGEALGGLTRAFIYAGVRSLIVSHWKIDSDATVRLMTSMFESKQPTQSGSLQAATLALMDSPDQYSHPYYWAAFTVVGDGARPMPR